MSEAEMADTPYRRNQQYVIRQDFCLGLFQRYTKQALDIRAAMAPHIVLVHHVTGATTGDGGPFLRFLHEDIVWPQWEIACEGKFYRGWRDKATQSVFLYDQKMDVSKKPNPPSRPHPELAEFRDRPHGYAWYPLGCGFIALRDVVVHPVGTPYNPALLMPPEGRRNMDFVDRVRTLLRKDQVASFLVPACDQAAMKEQQHFQQQSMQQHLQQQNQLMPSQHPQPRQLAFAPPAVAMHSAGVHSITEVPNEPQGTPMKQESRGRQAQGRGESPHSRTKREREREQGNTERQRDGKQHKQAPRREADDRHMPQLEDSGRHGESDRDSGANNNRRESNSDSRDTAASSRGSDNRSSNRSNRSGSGTSGTKTNDNGSANRSGSNKANSSQKSTSGSNSRSKNSSGSGKGSSRKTGSSGSAHSNSNSGSHHHSEGQGSSSHNGSRNGSTIYTSNRSDDRDHRRPQDGKEGRRRGDKHEDGANGQEQHPNDEADMRREAAKLMAQMEALSARMNGPPQERQRGGNGKRDSPDRSAQGSSRSSERGGAHRRN